MRGLNFDSDVEADMRGDRDAARAEDERKMSSHERATDRIHIDYAFFH